MSLEARVQALEDRQAEWDNVLAGIEGTVALILKEQMDLKKGQAELKKELTDFKEETRRRFDQLELLIRQLLPNTSN